MHPGGPMGSRDPAPPAPPPRGSSLPLGSPTNSLAIALLLCTTAVHAAPRQNVLEYVHAQLMKDRSLEPSKREALESALEDRFANYGFNVVKPDKPEDVRTLLHVICEGLLDDTAPPRIAERGFAASQAIRRGAPAAPAAGTPPYSAP